MSDFHTSYRSPAELKPRQRAFRTHPEAQIEAMCASIREYGLNQPPAIDAENNIVCGTAIVAAAVRLGYNRIPVVVLDHLNEAQLRSYAIAANKLADMAGYDEAELALEIADIQTLLGGLQLPELGIATPELDRLLAFNAADQATPAEAEPNPSLVISQPGDLWTMNGHSLAIGDALLGSTYEQLVSNELAQAVICDLPYNRPTNDFSTTGRFDDFKQGAGEMTSAEFVRFMTTIMRHLCGVTEDGSLHLMFMSYHFLLELLRAGAIAYDELKAIITWDKGSPGLGSLWRHQSEFVVAFKHGRAPHRTHSNKRNRTTVWREDGLSIFQAGRSELLAGHPTPKPVQLLKDAVLDVSDRGGIVLDPCAGSGTLALACEETGRRARMIEIDPVYADVALRRFRSATGVEPVLSSTGQTLAQCEAKALLIKAEEEGKNNAK